MLLKVNATNTVVEDVIEERSKLWLKKNCSPKVMCMAVTYMYVLV